jgi:hypothetical protein
LEIKGSKIITFSQNPVRVKQDLAPITAFALDGNRNIPSQTLFSFLWGNLIGYIAVTPGLIG